MKNTITEQTNEGSDSGNTGHESEASSHDMNRKKGT